MILKLHVKCAGAHKHNLPRNAVFPHTQQLPTYKSESSGDRPIDFDTLKYHISPFFMVENFQNP